MIEEIRDIPTLPQVTMELIQHAFVEEPDIPLLASIIEREPTLTAKLFKTVNSAAFGLRVEVKNIQQATSMLGIDTLKATIISIALGDYFINSSLGKELDAKCFCIHSLATGAIMREIAQSMGLKNAEQLYLLGLLHDLGKIVLDTIPGSEYGKVLDRVKEGETFEAAEKNTFGFDNLEVWEHLAATWGFPSEIIELKKGSIKGKIEIPTQKFLEDASNIAETLGHRLIHPSPRNTPLRFDILSLLGEDSLEAIGNAVKKQIDIIRQILDLPVPNETDVFKTLFKISRQLSLTNTRYRKVHRELEYRVEVLEDLTHVFTGIIKSLHGESLAYSVLEALIEGFHVNGASLLHSDGREGFTGYAALNTAQGEAGVYKIQLSKDQISSSMKQCIETRFPVKVVQPEEEPVLKDFLGDMPLVWLAPIYVRGRFNSILGLGIKDRASHKFNSDDFAKIIDIVAGEIGLSIENIRLYHRVKKEARTDPLTSMSNRRTIMKVLNSEFALFKRKGVPLSVAIFDMDHFKAINDSRGHLAGDDFLTKTALILKNGIRESDHIGRFGGDEFMAIFPDTVPEDAKTIVERIRKALFKFCLEFRGSDIPKKLSVSVGVAGADECMNHPDELIHLADNAMYQAKDSGRNRCFVHDPLLSPQKV